MNLDLTSTQTLIIILQGLLIMAIAIFLAKVKKRSPFFWGILSLFFGVYALFILVLLPRSQIKPSEDKDMVKPSLTPEEGTKEIPSNVEASTAVLKDPEPVVPVFSPDQLSTAEWYFVNDQKGVEGPFRLQKMKELVNEKKINEATWVWCELFSQWKKIQLDETLKKEILGITESTNRDTTTNTKP